MNTNSANDNTGPSHNEITPADKISLGGFSLLRTTTRDLSERLTHIQVSSGKQIVFFANTNFIVQCQPIKEDMTRANTIIVNDGIGVDIATWLVHRSSFPENLPGTDFIPHFLQKNNETVRVFLFGGKPGVAARAARELAAKYGVAVVGCCDGYGQASDAQQVVASINVSGANVLLVAMGNPMQEQWILDHYAELSPSVLMGVGALFDFWAGDKPRAPGLVRKLHLEWLYRLCLEPARLMRRYTLDIGVFLALCLRAGKSDLMTHQEKTP